jgi:hypothetical protein
MKSFKQTKRVYTWPLIFAVLACATALGELPPDPDNAALLYYQAYMQPEPDAEMMKALRAVAKGSTEPSKEVIAFVEESKVVLRFALAATELERCDWGYKYSDGWDMLITGLAESKVLAYLILADARIHAANGDYVTALERYLAVERTGRHISDKMLVTHLVGIAVKTMADERIRDMLSTVGDDLDTLNWIEYELTRIDSLSFSAKTCAEFELSSMGAFMTKEKVAEGLLQAEEGLGDKHFVTLAKRRVAEADEGFYQRNRTYHYEQAGKLIAAFELPYPDAFARIKELEEALEKEAQDNPDATLAQLYVPALGKVCSLDAQSVSRSNALMAAIAIYKVKAEAGRLPEELPSGLPKDPFSGEDFEYERTDEGFLLRCRGMDAEKDEVYEYEFKVKK